MLLPVPIKPLPQLPVYHLHLAKVPSEPPLTVRVTEEVPQVESADEAIEIAATLGVFTLMVLVAHVVVLQVPSARTKYCVVEAGVTAMLLPVPIKVPPQALVYHLQRALLPKEPPFTVRVTTAPPQVLSRLLTTETGATDKVFTLMVRVINAVVLHIPSARTL
jgi:hypothetical protein